MKPRVGAAAPSAPDGRTRAGAHVRGHRSLQSGGLFLLVFPFFHALGEAGFRVDESFSGITHDFDYTDRLAGAFTRPVKPAHYNQNCGWEGARPISSSGARVVFHRVPGAYQTAAARMARNRPRGIDAHSGADRKRQDAGCVSVVPEPADVRTDTAWTDGVESYVSPLKALAVDVERNLVPLAGIATAAGAQGIPVTVPQITIRTGDTPARERAVPPRTWRRAHHHA